MADVIQLLPDSVANQIAAGEVIQRPSSVIKELMENSVDAGATKIEVWVTDAGKTSIQVIDNGKGMSETDARLAFERHATSKIRQASDLFSLTTMGFRGEALPSIASVAQVVLKTKMKEDELGVQIAIDGSRIKEQIPVACNVGTHFSVNNLFFNVPARRRFLKSNNTELSNIMAEFERVALIHPDIHFKLYREDELALELLPGSFRKRIIDLFGNYLDKQLLPVGVETSLVKIDGFVGTPESARVKGAKQFFFVNQRYMRHPYFARAILMAYERLIPAEKQVPFFYRFEVDPARIDVNIHPTKTEIKFEDDTAIWQIIQAATKEALGRFNAVPTIDFHEGENIPEIPVYNPANSSAVSAPHITIDKNYSPFSSKEYPSMEKYRKSTTGWEEIYETIRKTSSSANNVETAEGDKTLYAQRPEKEQKEWKSELPAQFLQFKNHYIVFQSETGLNVVDQRRAHIRILYEKYQKQIKTDTPVSQGLLFPEIVHIPQSQLPVFNGYLPEFEQFGFDIVNAGGGNFALNGVPMGVDTSEPQALLMEIFEELQSSEIYDKDKINHQIALTLARRNAVKAEQQLSEEEISQLITDLLQTSSPSYTPDGHLILYQLTEEKLSSLFP